MTNTQALGLVVPGGYVQPGSPQKPGLQQKQELRKALRVVIHAYAASSWYSARWNPLNSQNTPTLV